MINRKILFKMLGVWWAFVLLLALLQAYFMSKNWLFLLLALAVPPLSGWFWWHWIKSIKNGERWAKILYHLFILLHLLPLLLQLSTFTNPRWEAILLAIFALVLLIYSPMRSYVITQNVKRHGKH